MGDPLGHLERAKRLQTYHQRWESLIVENPTSRDDDCEDAKAKHMQALEAWQTAFGNGDLVSTDACKKVLDCAGENYEQAVRRKNDERRERMETKLAKGLREHLNILGPNVIKKVYTQWLADQQIPPASIRDRDDEDALPADSITESRSVLPTRSPERSITVEPPAMSPPPTVDEPGHSLDVANEQDRIQHVGPVELLTSTPSTQNNRRPRSPDTQTPRPSKRRRDDGKPEKPLTKRKTTFAQVYRDGNPVKPRVIQYHRGNYYTVECAEHGKEFLISNAIGSAQNHLRSHYDRAKNPDLSLGWDRVLEELGTHVVGCKEDQAMKNNDFVLRNNDDDDADTKSNYSPTCPTTIDPQPGDVFETNHNDENVPDNAVIILPWERSCPRWIPSWVKTVEETNLIDECPACYKRVGGKGTDEWADGYRPGTSKGSTRQYPVLYFDSPRIPLECNFGWISVSKLKAYNHHESQVPYIDEIKEAFNDCEKMRQIFGVAEPHFANNDNITAATSANESTGVARPTGINHSSSQARRSSITLGKQAIRRPLNHTSDASFPTYDGLPTYEEYQRPSASTSSTSSTGSTGSTSSTSFTRSTFQLSVSNHPSHSHQEVEDLSMSDDVQAGPSVAHAAVPSETRVNAKMEARDETEAMFNKAFGDSYAYTAARGQRVSHFRASPPRLSNKSDWRRF